MQRSSEFPLFLQTTIALFGFLLLISLFSTLATPKTQASIASEVTVEVAKNINF